MKIELISFEKILGVWTHQLWPHRRSEIEPVSWIDSTGTINMQMSLGDPNFWCATENEQMIGVISGFKTDSERYRIRGLWVHENFRKNGIGKALIDVTQKQAATNNCRLIWTMPRQNVWPFYQTLGFTKYKSTEQFEYGPHFLAEKNVL